MKIGNGREGGWHAPVSQQGALKALFVLLLWAAGGVALWVFCDPVVPESEMTVVSRPTSTPDPGPAAGPIRYTQWDPQPDPRLRLSVSLDSLVARPGTLGIFKTGLFKAVQIRSLQVRKYEYPSDPEIAGATTIFEDNALRAIGLDGPGPAGGWFGGNSEPLRLINGMEIQIDRPDLSDIGEILVENFDYQVFLDGRPHLSIRSKRASASWEESGILLRGAVAIAAADGPTVRSNRIRWDPGKRVFSVEDNFLLTRGDMRTTGKSIYLDEQLNVIDTAQAGIDHSKSEGPNYARR